MEVIRRKTEAEKETFETMGYTGQFQVSYNSDGHLVLRFFTPKTEMPPDERDQQEGGTPKPKKDEDFLIALNAFESRLLIQFVKGTLKATYE